MDNPDQLLNQLKNQLRSVVSLSDFEVLKIKYLGRNGIINSLLIDIKNILSDQKKTYGRQVNSIKNSINQLIEQRKIVLLTKKSHQEVIDITLPGKPYPQGSLHPIAIAIDEICKIY